MTVVTDVLPAAAAALHTCHKGTGGCGVEGPAYRQIVLVILDGERAQKVVTGVYHCPEHELPQSSARRIAARQWLRIAANFMAWNNGKAPREELTQMVYCADHENYRDIPIFYNK